MHFSGGVHNLPRLLEDRGACTLTLNTSIISLFNSARATGQFLNPGTYYVRPRENSATTLTFLIPAKCHPAFHARLSPCDIIGCAHHRIALRTMLCSKFHLLSVLALGCWSSMEQAGAQESFSRPTTNAPIELRNEETVGDQQVRRAYITIGTNVLVFRVPTGCEIDASNSEKFVVSDPNHNCFITLSFGQEPAGSGNAFCRNLAQHSFTAATISGESTEFAADRVGPAFDLAWRNSGGF